MSDVVIRGDRFRVHFVKKGARRDLLIVESVVTGELGRVTREPGTEVEYGPVRWEGPGRMLVDGDYLRGLARGGFVMAEGAE